MPRFFVSSILLAALMLTSCYQYNKESSSIPEHLLSKKQMIEVLTQIQIAEGKVVLEREKVKDYRLSGKEYAQEIYQHFGITPEQLVDNLNYYQDQEDLLVAIYDEVLANLSTLEDGVKIEIEAEKLQIRMDSIHRVDSLAKILADSIAFASDTLVSNQKN